jgi:hypothetical protein
MPDLDSERAADARTLALVAALLFDCDLLSDRKKALRLGLDTAEELLRAAKARVAGGRAVSESALAREDGYR